MHSVEGSAIQHLYFERRLCSVVQGRTKLLGGTSGMPQHITANCGYEVCHVSLVDMPAQEGRSGRIGFNKPP